VATVYAGKIVEIADVETMFKVQTHPYTIGLINAVPTLKGAKEDLTSIPGSPPDLIDLPTAASSTPRCPLAEPRCMEQEPELEDVTSGHQVACWKWRTARESFAAFEVK